MSKLGFAVQRFRNGFAMVVGTGKDRSRHQLRSKDRPSAEAEARRVWADRDDGAWNVGRAVDAYLTKRADEGMITIQRRRDAWKAAKSFWESVDPEMIDEKMVRSYINRRNVAPGTVKLELGLIRAALRMAPKGKITSVPAISMPKVASRGIRHLEVAEFHRFLRSMRAPHARLYVMLGVLTLARPSAVLELKWQQVDMNRRLITLNPDERLQTSKFRPVVPIGDILHAALEIAFQMRTTEFVIEHGGKPISSVKKAFQEASKRSKVKATPYTLRHTGAVWAAEKGVPMSELAQLMGHDDDRTTQRHYARYSPNYLRNASNAIEATFAEEVQDEPTTPVTEE